LSPDGFSVYIPPGFAHGFQALEEGTAVFYKVTAEYDKKAKWGIRYDDPDLGILWPIKEAVVSDKDSGWPRLRDAELMTPQGEGRGRRRKPMKIIVTYGLGFIESNFIRYWLSSYPRVSVVNVDAMTYAADPDNLAGVKGDCAFVKAGLNDSEVMLWLAKDADAIVNFAAESHVDRSISDSSPLPALQRHGRPLVIGGS